MSFMALLMLLKDGTLGLQGISGVKVLHVYVGMGFTVTWHMHLDLVQLEEDRDPQGHR